MAGIVSLIVNMYLIVSDRSVIFPLYLLRSRVKRLT